MSEAAPVEGGQPFDTQLAYLGGLYMGDGCYYQSTEYDRYQDPVRTMHRFSFSCGKDVGALVPELRKWFGVIWTPRENGDITINRDSQAARFYTSFPKQHSSGANVPECIWTADLVGRRAFLSGAFDSDGSAHSGRITISSISESYIRSLAILAGTIGVFGTIRKTRRPTNFSPLSECWHFDVFAAESTALFPDSRIPRKQIMLERVRSKSYTQCRTEYIPMPLIERYNGIQHQCTPASNRLFSNGRRHGRVTRAAVRKAAASSEVLRDSGISELLRFRYDRVVSVAPHSVEDVYDLTVEGEHRFNTDGYRVHNSQGELRVIACIADCKSMIEISRKGLDL